MNYVEKFNLFNLFSFSYRFINYFKFTIYDKTSIPYAPKARKIIEETKKKEEDRLVSEQAPPAAKAKEKPDRIPLPNEKKEEKQIVKKKQNPEEVKPEIRQASEFEKKEIVDTNQIAALIDKAKEVEAVKKKTDKLTQSTQKNSFATGLTLSQEDALRAQIFGCWSVPLGLPYDEDLLVRIKLCQPLKVPPTGYDKWKELQLNFNPTEMLKG